MKKKKIKSWRCQKKLKNKIKGQNSKKKKRKKENPDGQRRLAGCSPRGCKELDMTEATEHACMHFISLKDAEAET